jgi:hypothetical protein
MTQRIRLKRGSRNPNTSAITKAEFIAIIEERGAKVEFRRDAVGQWNEGREILLNGSRVWKTHKGERVNWLEILGYVESILNRQGDAA